MSDTAVNVEIRETIVTPGDGDVLVQLHISDKPPELAGAAIRQNLAVRVPAYQTPLLAQIERQAMSIATDALWALLQDSANAISRITSDLSRSLLAIRRAGA